MPKKCTNNKDAATLIFPPNLFLGPLSSASFTAFISSHSITHILSIGSTPDTHIPGVVYNRLSLTDSPSSPISKTIDAANDFIDAAIASHNRSGKILIHCSAAVSRSPTIVVAYLMTRHRLSLKQALGLVVRLRPSVSPNAGFLAQLRDLEKDLFGRVTLEVEALPRRKQDRLALFEEVGEDDRALVG
jgi:atypical dual specificity phosphatase